MWATVVVLMSPPVKKYLGFCNAFEEFTVQKLIS